MYDGTLTISDPNLVTKLDTGTDQTRAYVLRDTDAAAPDWDGIGYVYRIGYDRRGTDAELITGDGDESDPMPVGVVRAAWDRFGDWDTVARYLAIYHGVVSTDWDTMTDRDGYIVGCVTAAHVEAWGTGADMVPDLARDAIRTYASWADGEVYGVVVVKEESGAEVSLWNVYDSSSNLVYCATVAVELAEEVAE